MRPCSPLLLLLALTACRKDDTGSSPDPEDTALTVGEVRLGEPCPRMEQAGAIQLSLSEGRVSLGGMIYNAPQPITGAPALANDHCTYHRYDASGCGACAAPLVCSGAGNCVPMPTAFTDLEVTATAGATTHTAQGDPDYGWLYEQWDDVEDDWALELSFGQDRITAPAMPIADGDIGVAVAVESADETAPGALTVTWTPTADGSLVRTEIPINHHAQPGTFTLCEGDAALGGFTADATMIDPLAVITGLEFQGVEHLQVASAQTSVGCVELRYGTQVRVNPSYGR
jgi:hypothetical protein